jgi:2,4-dienoyl-CoA reductase-like NADH-dependent reductase (Old Yellow Enzyme family)
LSCLRVASFKIAEAFRAHLEQSAIPLDFDHQSVDVKARHGYLGHELLGARGRAGKHGGPLENRMRFMRQVIEGIRAKLPRSRSSFVFRPSTRCRIVNGRTAWASPR